MRTGTIFCKLFGHKFCWMKPLIMYGNHASSWQEPINTDFCVRCGIDKEKNCKICESKKYKKELGL